jgi:hypothetical protein
MTLGSGQAGEFAPGGTQTATAWRSILDAVVEVTAGEAGWHLPQELEQALRRAVATRVDALSQGDSIVRLIVADYLSRLPAAFSVGFSDALASEVYATIQEHPELSRRLGLLCKKLQEQTA